MNRPALKRLAIPLAAGLALALAVAPADAQPLTTYRVTVTNLTHTEILSPPIVATHTLGSPLFRIGQTATPELAAVAEDAEAADLLQRLSDEPGVLDFAIAEAPLPPGESVQFDLQAGGPFHRLTALGMLVTTNDAFFAVDRVQVIGRPFRKEFHAVAYDAGSEANTELCAHIPGPPCENPGVRVTEGAEGFIHVHRGIQGGGDLDPAVWDWRNPVASVVVFELPNQPTPQ